MRLHHCHETTTDELRDALFDAARVSIAEVGYSAVSHADITAAVAIESADVDLSPPLGDMDQSRYPKVETLAEAQDPELNQAKRGMRQPGKDGRFRISPPHVRHYVHRLGRAQRNSAQTPAQRCLINRKL